VLAPEGTVTAMLFVVQLVGVAEVPLNVTVLDPCVVPKSIPVIVRGAPISPAGVDRLEMIGPEEAADPTV
jgi:hypothetical protein